MRIFYSHLSPLTSEIIVLSIWIHTLDITLIMKINCNQKRSIIIINYFAHLHRISRANFANVRKSFKMLILNVCFIKTTSLSDIYLESVTENNHISDAIQLEDFSNRDSGVFCGVFYYTPAAWEGNLTLLFVWNSNQL